jgi:DNA-binding CsgD family transcriptional regulator
LRLGQYGNVLSRLGWARQDGIFSDAVDAARAWAFEAVAYACLGRGAQAYEAIARSRITIADANVAAELRLNDALVSWMLGDLPRAGEIIDADIARGCAGIDTSLAARFFMLHGWLCAAQERYVDQAHALLDAIARLESAPRLDTGLLAWAVFPLAALVRDLNIPFALEVVQRLEESLSWTEDLAMAHFQTVRAVAWAFTLRGEYIRAFRKFSAAQLIAPSPIAKMLAHTDHAHCARFCGQDIVADAQIAELEDLVRSYDWSKAVWEEARALVGAAELVAGRDACRALEILEQAEMLRPAMARNAGYVHDRRLGAHADYADALVREASGDRRVAAHRAKRAYAVFHAIGYDWQAARCALLLYKLAQGDEWLTRAQESISAYPRSYVAQEISKCGDRDPLQTLTARQREVVEYLRRGSTIDQIARELRVSPNTVRVHITRIHHAFGVERRSQLLAKLAS